MAIQQSSNRLVIPALLCFTVLLLVILGIQSKSYGTTHPTVSCSIESTDGYYHEHSSWKCIRIEENKVYTDTYVFDGKVGYLTEIKS